MLVPAYIMSLCHVLLGPVLSLFTSEIIENLRVLPYTKQIVQANNSSISPVLHTRSSNKNLGWQNLMECQIRIHGTCDSNYIRCYYAIVSKCNWCNIVAMPQNVVVWNVKKDVMQWYVSAQKSKMCWLIINHIDDKLATYCDMKNVIMRCFDIKVQYVIMKKKWNLVEYKKKWMMKNWMCGAWCERFEMATALQLKKKSVVMWKILISHFYVFSVNIYMIVLQL